MIRNTSKEAQDNPALQLGKLMFGGPNAIEHQEAQGQRELCAESAALPVECDPLGVAALEKAGVKFGAVRQNDDVFRDATLPAGWKIVPTDHSMWSKLLDNEGRERAKIFYKAAFYDRSAHMGVCTRYIHADDYGDETKTLRIKDAVTGVFVWQSESLPKRDYAASDEAYKAAEEWMAANFPDWRDPGAYWVPTTPIAPA